MRWATRWPDRSARRSGTTSCTRAANSTFGRRPSARSARRASNMSTGSTFAPRATANASSRTGATMDAPDARESLPTSADAVRERYERVQSEVGADVTIVVATKYVSLDDMKALSDAGVSVVGENRAQDLEAKHARY